MATAWPCPERALAPFLPRDAAALGLASCGLAHGESRHGAACPCVAVDAGVLPGAGFLSFILTSTPRTGSSAQGATPSRPPEYGLTAVRLAPT